MYNYSPRVAHLPTTSDSRNYSFWVTHSITQKLLVHLLTSYSITHELLICYSVAHSITHLLRSYSRVTHLLLSCSAYDWHICLRSIWQFTTNELTHIIARQVTQLTLLSCLLAWLLASFLYHNTFISTCQQWDKNTLNKGQRKFSTFLSHENFQFTYNNNNSFNKFKLNNI